MKKENILQDSNYRWPYLWVFFFFFFAISTLKRCLEEQNFDPFEDSLLSAALQVCTHKHSDGLGNVLNWQNFIKPWTQIFICPGMCLGKVWVWCWLSLCKCGSEYCSFVCRQMTSAPSSRLLRPCPDWGPRLGPTPTHGWCEADLL